MITISLPDGTQKQYKPGITAYDVAADIGAGLAKAALAGQINDKLVDLTVPITQDANLKIITEKDPEGLEIIRHSAAHLLAHAIKHLFPNSQITIGPVIDNGFYYDVSFERHFTPDDLVALEAKMVELAKNDYPVKRFEMSREEAITFFKNIHENYKVQIIKDIPGNEALSFYQQGDFTDLCRGPHVPSTAKLKVFKLMHLAGAYWRGDSNNEMLQRIYGTAWRTKQELDDYLHRLEEAERRDHRKTARVMDLFHQQDIAPGMVFWHNNGWVIYRAVENYIRQKLQKHGYIEVRTPQIMSGVLWEKSGHWENYAKEMFITHSEEKDFAVKPMNCPGHVQIFNQGLKSYRDLPIRMAEFGSCHRNEPSGALHGLMRVRQFTQDDAHIFCTEDQIQSEVSSLIKLVFEVYKDFGFSDILIKLSTRPEQRVGSDATWDKAEKALEDALNSQGIEWELNPGDGAFYGPKIDISLKDCIGRIWQCGTIQLDFSMPERLEAHYIAEDGSKKLPVMIHRAITGSIERFIGILLEQYADELPLWLSPVQAVIMTITDNQHDYAKNLSEELKKHALRVNIDLRNEKIGYKIREHTLARVPYLLIVGEKEVTSNTVSVRKRSGEDLGAMSLESLLQTFAKHL
ncbi:MAG: threonine--tRNA ligase [Gammaproteobacteria bacterium]